MEKRNNCLNKISHEQKITLLKMVLDDDSFRAIKNSNKIDEAFEVNMANILISTRGEF